MHSLSWLENTSFGGYIPVYASALLKMGIGGVSSSRPFLNGLPGKLLFLPDVFFKSHAGLTSLQEDAHSSDSQPFV